MLRTFYLDVKDATRTVNRFEVRFVLNGEAIEHSKQLAASLRHRHFPNKQGLTIEVLKSGQKLHEEAVYPGGYPETLALVEYRDARSIKIQSAEAERGTFSCTSW
jgi:hypothetical protein